MRQTISLGLQLFASAVLALALAHWLNLANPYWAAMPVWVVQQAYREDLVLRAVLRVVGTLVGATLALGVVWLSLPHWVAAIVLAVGVGCATACASWIGTVMSYGAFMAGVTLFVVLLPEFTGFGVSMGLDPTAASLERILCTLIGVASVTAITFAFTPRRIGEEPSRVLKGRARAALLRLVYCCGTTACAATMAIIFPNFSMLAGAMTLIVYSMILSCAPDPQSILPTLVPAVVLGVFASVIYLILLKNINADVPWFATLLTAAFMVVGAFLRAWPRTAPYGLDANMCFLIVSEVGVSRHGVTEVALTGVFVVFAAFLASFSGRRMLVARL